MKMYFLALCYLFCCFFCNAAEDNFQTPQRQKVMGGQTPGTVAASLPSTQPVKQIKQKGDDERLAEDLDGHLGALKLDDAPLDALSPNYLGFGGPSTGCKYMVSMCPINSSGDIYHILAYIILAKAEKSDVPPIVLTYDTKDTKDQIDRSIAFAQWLGYGQSFSKPSEIDTGNCWRQKPRQKKLVKTPGGEYTHLIDQKALTTVVAKLFKEQGEEKVSNDLRKGFEHMDAKKYPDLTLVQQGAQQEVAKIIKHKSTPPLVVMHIRYSSTANKEQNLSDKLCTQVEGYLKERGHQVWFIFADGRTKGSFTKIGDGYRTNVFPYPRSGKKYATPNPKNLGTNADYGKFFHLHMLLELRKMKDVRFIGNTSGTLDLAAFVGHKVYNLHQMKENIDYQTMRIMIQSAFLTLECISTTSAYETNHLESWLKNEKQTPPKPKLEEFNKRSTQAGYKELCSIRALKEGEDDISLGFVKDLLSDFEAAV